MYPLNCIKINSMKSLGKELYRFSFCFPKCPNTFGCHCISISNYNLQTKWLIWVYLMFMNSLLKKSICWTIYIYCIDVYFQFVYSQLLDAVLKLLDTVILEHWYKMHFKIPLLIRIMQNGYTIPYIKCCNRFVVAEMSWTRLKCHAYGLILKKGMHFEASTFVSISWV